MRACECVRAWARWCITMCLYVLYTCARDSERALNTLVGEYTCECVWESVLRACLRCASDVCLGATSNRST